MKKRLLLIGFALILASCNTVSYKPFVPSAVSSPINSVIATNREGGFFLVDYVDTETGKVNYDFRLQDLQGKGLIAKYGLVQPRDHIKALLLADVARKFDARIVKSNKKIDFFTDDKTLSSIPKVYNNADLIVDVVTTDWSLRFNEGNYHLTIKAEGRLIERATGKVVAYNVCSDKAPAYPEQQLLAKNASLLKNQINALSKRCAQQLYTAMFSR